MTITTEGESPMRIGELGRQGLAVLKPGRGCMDMPEFYTDCNAQEAITILITI